MKNLLKSTYLAIFCLGVFVFPSNTIASHMVGGEISWKCLSNGKFVFQLTLYRQCFSSGGHNYSNTLLDIVHNASNAINFPKDTNGQVITSIMMQPDSNRWVASNFGDLSPDCSFGNSYTCGAGNRTLQAFFYTSDPIRINGIPPSTGWNFNHLTACCRANSDNLASSSSGTTILKSIMYPIPIPNTSPQQYYSTDTCRDQSPIFAVEPNNHFCRGKNYHVGNYASDDASDSISYSFTNSLTGTTQNPINIGYLSGFSSNLPFPNYSTDTLNAPIILNPKTGNLQFGVHTGSGPQTFQYCLKIDSYRDGYKIASVQREIPIYILGCQSIPVFQQNNSPEMKFFGSSVDTFLINLNVGQTLNTNLIFTDLDYDSSRFPHFQNFSVRPMGTDFATNFTNSVFCENPPCATLSPPPTVNINTNKMEISGLNSANVQINWQAGANHLNSYGKAKDHYFHFQLQDDQCPIPGKGNATLIIRVHPLGTRLGEAREILDDIEIYPNPNNGNVNLRFPKLGKYQIRVSDLTGKLVKQERVPGKQNHSLFIEHSGVYILQVIDELGKQQMKKIVVR